MQPIKVVNPHNGCGFGFGCQLFADVANDVFLHCLRHPHILAAGGWQFGSKFLAAVGGQIDVGAGGGVATEAFGGANAIYDAEVVEHKSVLVGVGIGADAQAVAFGQLNICCENNRSIVTINNFANQQAGVRVVGNRLGNAAAHKPLRFGAT